MRVPMRKIRETVQSFSIHLETMHFFGEFHRSGHDAIEIDATLEGELSCLCDRCGEPFMSQTRENVRLVAVERPLKANESLDVVECPDGLIDFEAIGTSEIASLQSEYHLCPTCARQASFEMEF